MLGVEILKIIKRKQKDRKGIQGQLRLLRAEHRTRVGGSRPPNLQGQTLPICLVGIPRGLSDTEGAGCM